MKQIGIPDYQYYLGCNAKKNKQLSFLRKKSSYFNRKYRLNRLLFAYSIFKNTEILSGQRVVQIKPISA